MKLLKKAVAVILAVLSAFMCTAPAFAADYSDIKGHWAEAHIKKCTEYGIVQGDSGRFYPDLYVTRAELAAMLDRLMGYTALAPNHFNDLENDAWYTESILHLADAGVMLGNGLGSVRPSAKVTREEAVTMIARAFLMHSDGTAALEAYADASSVAYWAREAVAVMTERGYINGIDGSFYPQNYMTRAEAAKVFSEIIGEIYTKNADYTTDIKGNLIIKSETGLRIKGVTIDGNVVITPQVKGEVVLEDVVIAGNLVILCNGELVTIKTTPPVVPEPEPEPEDKIKIYIDPGHGYGDPGTVYPKNNPTLYESTVTLKLSLIVAEKLTAMGFDVRLSHTTNNKADNPDTSSSYKMTLPYRYRDANNWGADMFISLHVNSYTNSSVSGIRSFYPTQNASGGTLSKQIQYAGERLCKKLNSSAVAQVGQCTTSVTNKNYDVLKYTDMLSALFEIGFITNATDRANMQNDAWLEKMATGIANGIADFANTENLDAYKY